MPHSPGPFVSETSTSSCLATFIFAFSCLAVQNSTRTPLFRCPSPRSEAAFTGTSVTTSSFELWHVVLDTSPSRTVKSTCNYPKKWVSALRPDIAATVDSPGLVQSTSYQITISILFPSTGILWITTITASFLRANRLSWSVRQIKAFPLLSYTTFWSRAITTNTSAALTQKKSHMSSPGLSPLCSAGFILMLFKMLLIDAIGLALDMGGAGKEKQRENCRTVRGSCNRWVLNETLGYVVVTIWLYVRL